MKCGATLFCDSAGVRELVLAHKRATAVGTAFRVVVSHHYLRDRLTCTGLAAYLLVYPTVREAVAAGPDGEVLRGPWTAAP